MLNIMNLGADDAPVEQRSTRRDFLKVGGAIGAGAALAGVPSIFASLIRPTAASAQMATPTVQQVLEFALTLEYLEFEFYERGLMAAGLIPATDRTIFRTFRDHEAAHVIFLEETLGIAHNSRKPNFDFTAGGAFPDALTNYATYRALSQAFEDTGVRAYKGQAPNLMSNDLALTAALQIHSVEGRHAAMIRRLNGNFAEQAPQKAWITGRNSGVVPAAAAAVYGPGMPPETFPAEDNVTQGGVDLTTLTFTPELAGNRALTISEAFDEPLDMQTVLNIASLFIQS